MQLQAIKELRAQVEMIGESLDIIIKSFESEENINIDKARKSKAEYMREYMKEWRYKNPKKAEDIQNRYWTKRYNQSK